MFVKSGRTVGRGLVAVAVVVLMLFSGLPGADAGITFGHGRSLIPKDGPGPEIGGGEFLTQITNGSWTEYGLRGDADTVSYRVHAEVASDGTGGTITISVDGADVGSVEVSPTGGSQTWDTVSTFIEIDQTGENQVIRLTYAGQGDQLFNVRYLTFEELTVDAINTARLDAMNELALALESYAAAEGTFRVAGGIDGGGYGWAFYEDEGRYSTSIATALIDGGHLSPDPLHDQLWTGDTSIAGDVLVYTCRDRAAVFTREGDGQPTADDQAWWQDNGCFTGPIDFGATDYVVTKPRESSEEVRREAVDVFLTALESYGADNGTYRVADAGFRGWGAGYAFYEGENYERSIASVLIDEGHLAADSLRDELWIDSSSGSGDFIVYTCLGRVGVFSLEGDGEPSAEDAAWWSDNDCNDYPTERMHAAYFKLSEQLW